MDTLINYGSEIKVIGETDDAWQVGGWAVVFNTHDASHLKDMFAADTDFDFENGDQRSLYYNHGLDGTLKATRIGRASLELKDGGVWYSGEIKKRTDYLKVHAEKIIEGVKNGVFGTSTGAPAHLVRREKIEGGHAVKLWPISEISITPTPAEPLTTCVSLKSLMGEEESQEEQTAARIAARVSAYTAEDVALNLARKMGQEDGEDETKGLNGLNAWSSVEAAQRALGDLGMSAQSQIAQLMHPDHQEYNKETQDYFKPSFEQRMEGVRKILSDYADTAMTMVEAMSRSAERLSAKSLDDLTESLPDGLSFDDHSKKVLDAVSELLERAESLAELRCVKSNRPWSEAKYVGLTHFSQELKNVAAGIDDLAEAHQPRSESVVDNTAVTQAMARFAALKARTMGVSI